MKLLKNNQCLYCLLAGVLLCVPMIVWDGVPVNDCAARYAPMAEAFAGGDWQYAFHPRIPPLLPLTAGCIAKLTGCSGFTAAKVASSLFFVLTILPLFGLARMVWGARNAVWTIWLYLLCSRLLRLAGMGLRDSAKCFCFVLAAYALLSFMKAGKWRHALLLGIGAAGLALTRGDCLVYALLLLAAGFVVELAAYCRRGRERFPVRIAASFLLFLLLLAPWVQYEYRLTGWPVTEVRMAMLLDRLNKKFKCGADALSGAAGRKLNVNYALAGIVGDFHLVKKILAGDAGRTGGHMQIASAAGAPPVRVSAISDVAAAAPRFESVGGGKFELQTTVVKPFELSNFFSELFNGFFPPYLILVLPVLFFRIKNRELSRMEIVLLGIVVSHAVLQIAQISIADSKLYVSKRYLISAAPLTFGWAAIGLRYVAGSVRRRMARRRRWLVSAILIIAALILLADAWHRLRPSLSPRKRAAEYGMVVCAEWLKLHGKAISRKSVSRKFNIYEYNSGGHPALLSSSPRVSGLCGAKYIDLADCKQDIVAFCRENEVNLILLHNNLIGAFSDQAGSAMFIKIKDFNRDGYPYAVFAFKPNVLEDKLYGVAP